MLSLRSAVCQKTPQLGIQAALVVMVIQGMYEPFKRGTKLPGEILTEMNKNFVDKYSQLNTFFTCVIIEINPLTKILMKQNIFSL